MTTNNPTTTPAPPATCSVLECNQPTSHRHALFGRSYCEYHASGGMFASGESYEKYQIIEEDFIEFIKSVPLTPEHFTVYSPVLRDILIRSCIEIEIFFKEWAKFECSRDDIQCPLLKDPNDIRKTVKGWKISDYVYFAPWYKQFNSVYVLALNETIIPFENWAAHAPPFWWDAYNSVKHDGHTNKRNANLKNALYALAALFRIHCANRDSMHYLKGFRHNEITERGISALPITSPIDSKRYLFKAPDTGETITDFEDKHAELIKRMSTI